MSFDIDYDIPTIITKRNVDSMENPIGVKLLEKRQVMDNHSCIVLSQIPDENYRITIEGFNEVFNSDELGNNNFYVNYSQGVIHFLPRYKGKTVVIEYYGIGYELISASRVFYKYDKHGGIIETLEEILDNAKEQLELIKTLGDSVKVIEKLEMDLENGKVLHDNLENDIEVATPLQQNLHADVVEATKWKDQLHQDVTDGKVLQPLLQQTIDDAEDVKIRLDQSIENAQDDINTINATGNEIKYITASQWTWNSTNEMYEYTLTHTMNSKALTINCFYTENDEFAFIGGRIVDKNNILFRNEEAVNLTVVLNSRYYKPEVTTSSEVIEEVTEARFGEVDLKTKITKIDEDIITTNNKMIELKTNLDKKIDDELTELKKTLDEDFTLYENTVNDTIANFKNEVKNDLEIYKNFIICTNANEFKEALNKCTLTPTIIYLVNGDYVLSETLYIPSNTKVVGLGLVTIKGDGLNCYISNNASENATEYNGSNNIHIENIIFDGKDKADGLTMIGFAHAEHITIKDCVFKNLHMWHMIELNAVRHGLIYGCKFTNYGNIGTDGTEAIQLDAMISEAQFPWFGSYDDTACRYITIENNIFEDIGKKAIGHHSFKSGVILRDVTIKNNFFNRVNTCINLNDFNNLLITENKAYDMRGFFISQNANNDCNVLNISKNTVRGYFISSIEGMGDERFIGLNVSGKPDSFNFYHVTITENDVSLIPGHAIGIVADYVTISNNNFYRVYRNGIYHWGGHCANISNNNFRDVGMGVDVQRRAILVDGGGYKSSRVVISNNAVANLGGIEVKIGTKGVEKILVANNVSSVTNSADTDCTVINNIN